VKQEQSRLTGAGGIRIFWQAWLPDGEPGAAVVIAHGAGEHSDRYAHVAARLVADGYAVYAIEHRGHGRSDGKRALIDRLDNAVADLGTLIDTVRERHPEVPVFLLAHSMGGTIGVSYALKHEERLAGLILSGPLAALEPSPLPQRIIVGIVSAVAPAVGLIAIDPALVSRDPAVVDAYVRDPMVFHGKLPARTITELATAIDAFPEAVRAITIPVLIVYGTDDGLCPPAGSVMLGERIGSEDKTIKPYEGLHHEVLNEPEQHAVLDDVCAWIAARVGVRT
jgi:acylglycerol lipase